MKAYGMRARGIAVSAFLAAVTLLMIAGLRESARAALHPEQVQMQQQLTKALEEMRGGVEAARRALIERCGMVGRANADMYNRKVGAAVVAVRRAGGLHVFNSLNYFFSISGMIIPGSSYWNIGIGRQPGEVNNDAEGVQTMKNLGKNMAWLLKKVQE